MDKTAPKADKTSQKYNIDANRKTIFRQNNLRLSKHLKYHDPNGKYAIIMDNVRSHKSLVQYPNLDLVMLEPDTTAYMQPLDTMVFDILKKTVSILVGKVFVQRRINNRRKSYSEDL